MLDRWVVDSLLWLGVRDAEWHARCTMGVWVLLWLLAVAAVVLVGLWVMRQLRTTTRGFPLN